jgi:hypothetical protein
METEVSLYLEILLHPLTYPLHTQSHKMTHGGGGLKLAKKVSRIIWMAPFTQSPYKYVWDKCRIKWKTLELILALVTSAAVESPDLVGPPPPVLKLKHETIFSKTPKTPFEWLVLLCKQTQTYQ